MKVTQYRDGLLFIKQECNSFDKIMKDVTCLRAAQLHQILAYYMKDGGAGVRSEGYATACVQLSQIRSLCCGAIQRLTSDIDKKVTVLDSLLKNMDLRDRVNRDVISNRIKLEQGPDEMLSNRLVEQIAEQENATAFCRAGLQAAVSDSDEFLSARFKEYVDIQYRFFSGCAAPLAPFAPVYKSFPADDTQTHTNTHNPKTKHTQKPHTNIYAKPQTPPERERSSPHTHTHTHTPTRNPSLPRLRSR
eukprot:GHVR01020253.1.p1 GENE.GHVR01020253.1~~GHVR01020253.1.p1  ORF type:complete len:247 (-),score=67.82 GHVR01020253.1:35-775(-)